MSRLGLGHRMSRWHPARTSPKYGAPAVGDLMAVEHAVWSVEHVKPTEDGAGWTVTAHHVGGWRNPKWVINSRGDIGLRVPEHASLDVYADGRWPACSCCGEPVPCRAELIDLAAAAAAEQLESLERRLPGCCWDCGEPITARQRSVTYAGENLDLPSGPEVMFHTRRSCLRRAKRYEERWVAAGLPRILTWPPCSGTLIVHHDGTSECHGGLDDCWGHSTHDHRTLVACYCQTHGCPRECPVEGHPGCAPSDRRERRAAT